MPTHAHATSSRDTEAITHPAEFVYRSAKRIFLPLPPPFFFQPRPRPSPRSPLLFSSVNHRANIAR